jgi:hypothetical protein
VTLFMKVSLPFSSFILFGLSDRQIIYLNSLYERHLIVYFCCILCLFYFYTWRKIVETFKMENKMLFRKVLLSWEFKVEEEI